MKMKLKDNSMADYDNLDGDVFEPSPGCCSVRYGIAWMTFMGFMIMFGMRCNMGIAMIQMLLLNKTIIAINGTDTTSMLREMEVSEFDWSAEVVGLISSAYFWGYLITQLPGGYLSTNYPANRVFGIGVSGSALLNILLPAACKIHYTVAIAVRVAQGLFEGVTYPASYGLLSTWAPPLERSTLATIVLNGQYAGEVIGMAFTGILTKRLGWESSFYFFGTLGLLWFVVWWLVSSDAPSSHPYISEQEKVYIEKSQDPSVQTQCHGIPWRSIFNSAPVYAILLAYFCTDWIAYLLITSQAKYLNDVFQFDVDQIGILSALPQLLMAIFVPIGGVAADYLRSNKILSTTGIRKLFNCGGNALEASLLIAVAYIRNPTIAVVLLTLAVGASGLAVTGFAVNNLDIAPRYAGILMGLANMVGTLAGITVPIVADIITKNQSAKEWRIVFITASLILFAGVIFYGIFASGEKQDWAEPVDQLDDSSVESCIIQTDLTVRKPLYGTTSGTCEKSSLVEMDCLSNDNEVEMDCLSNDNEDRQLIQSSKIKSDCNR